MMRINKIIILVALSSFFIGCGDLNDDGDNATSPSTTSNSVSSLVAIGVDKEADALADKTQLVTDIEKLFGGVSAEAIEVNDGESVSTLTTRLGS